MPRGILNLGILAHVDAGKTTLTERLLYCAGVIDEPGSVDDGTTQTDSLELERQRGITIKSAVVSFTVDGTVVNLIDTPGHPDFVAEVERALSVLDGVVLVISAVEGVQPQTRILWRALQRLRIPTLFFVNKIDRRGAGYERLLGDIAERLTPAIVPMGSVSGLGTREAAVIPLSGAGPAARSRLAEVLADHDDAVLAAYLDDRAAIPGDWLRREAGRAGQGHAGASGVLRVGHHRRGRRCAAARAARDLLPVADGDASGPVSGRVFKVERGPRRRQDRLCPPVLRHDHVRRSGDRVPVLPQPVPSGRRGDRDGKVTAISVFADGTAERRDSVTRRPDRPAVRPGRDPDRRRDRDRARRRWPALTSRRRRWRPPSWPATRATRRGCTPP